MKIEILLILANLLALGRSVTETVDLITGQGCGRTSQVAGGVVQSHQPFDTTPPISNDFICFFQMQAVRMNQRVRFMFIHFSLSPDDCSMANLTIFDGPRDTDPEIALICPDTPDVLTREFVSTRIFLTLKLQMSSDSAAVRSANFSGFYVSYTEDRNPCIDPSLELMCSNGRCIFQELECDGYNSCGDTANTDEPSSCTNDASNNPDTGGINPSTEGLFSDLTPLYIILTMAFTMLAVYIIYILLSFQWFKTLMVSCLHRCCLFAIRKRRKWKEKDEESEKKSNGKVSPVIGNVMTTTPEKPMNENKPPTTDPVPPVAVPPVFIAPTASGKPNNTEKSATKTKPATTQKTPVKRQPMKNNFIKPSKTPRNINSSVTSKKKLSEKKTAK